MSVRFVSFFGNYTVIIDFRGLMLYYCDIISYFDTRTYTSLNIYN